MHEKVAVIIVNFNGGEIILRSLNALMQQTVLPERIIVVDNDSKDNSVASIRAKFPTVEVIEQGFNSGFACGNNVALSQLREEKWVALLNPDAFPHPDWLEKLLEATMLYPEYSFFASRTLTAENPDILDGAGDCYFMDGRMQRRGYHQKASNRYLETEEVFSPCAAAALYRTDIVREMKGFDEDFFCYAEDVDLGFRLRLSGYRCLYVPKAIALHMGSVFSGEQSDFTLYHGYRNRIWTYVKNMPGTLFWTRLPFHLLLQLRLLLSLIERPGLAFRIIRDGIQGLPKMVRKRKKIQVSRKVTLSELKRMLS